MAYVFLLLARRFLASRYCMSRQSRNDQARQFSWYWRNQSSAMVRAENSSTTRVQHDIAACKIAVDRREGGRSEIAQVPYSEAGAWRSFPVNGRHCSQRSAPRN